MPGHSLPVMVGRGAAAEQSGPGSKGRGLSAPFVIVDGSNVAHAAAGADGVPVLRALCQVIDELHRASLSHVVIADASLRHRIDDRAGYEALVRGRLVLQAPAGCSADRFIVVLGRKRESEGQSVRILTADRLADHDAAGLARIAFMVISTEEILCDPPIDTLGSVAPVPAGEVPDGRVGPTTA